MDKEPKAGCDSHLRTRGLRLAILVSSVVLQNEGPERKTCKRVEWDSSASREGTGIQEGFPRESMRNYTHRLPGSPGSPASLKGPWREAQLRLTPCSGSFLSWTPPQSGSQWDSSGRVGESERGARLWLPGPLGIVGSNMT